MAEEPRAAPSEVEATYFVVEPSREQLIQLARLVDADIVRAVIDSAFPLADAPAAFERVMGPRKRGKVVLKIHDS